MFLENDTFTHVTFFDLSSSSSSRFVPLRTSSLANLGHLENLDERRVTPEASGLRVLTRRIFVMTRSRCHPTRMIGSWESVFRTSSKKPLPTITHSGEVQPAFFFPTRSSRRRRGNARRRVKMWAPLTHFAYRLSTRERALPPGCRSLNAGDGVDRRRWQDDDAARASWYRRLAVLKTRALNRTIPSIHPVSPRSPLSSASL